ncbi:MAG: hypothetical protein ACOC7S_01760 [Planctomycetota bacterium]
MNQASEHSRAGGENSDQPDSRPPVVWRIVFSTLLAVPYAMRVGLNDLVYPPEPHSFWRVAFSCRVHFTFVLSGLLAFGALSVGAEAVDTYKRKFLHAVWDKLRELFSVRSLLLGVAISVVLSLAAGVPEGEPVGRVLGNLSQMVGSKLASLRSVATVVGVLLGLAVISGVISWTIRSLLGYYGSHANEIVIRAFEEWQIISTLLAVVGVALLWAGGFTLEGIEGEATLESARLALYKDALGLCISLP